MLNWPSLTLFLIASLILLLTPGPAVLYIMARSLNQGRRAGLISAMGLGVGNLIHVAGAVLGISALLASSAFAFNALKYIGAAYLIYLGVRKLLTKEDVHQAAAVPQQSLPNIFYQGVFVNFLNPKLALFYLAFLPQFVDVHKEPIASQTLFLGLLFVIMGITTDSLYALVAGTMGQWLKGLHGFARAQHYFTGSVYIGLGLVAALTGSHAMVTEHQAWSEQTAVWLAQAILVGLPTLGICYGHQLLAYALDGEVAYNPRGREYGTVQVRLYENACRDPLFSGLPNPVQVHASHAQTVLRLPAGAICLASSDMDDYQAFSIGGYAWGVQFHPEFDVQVVREYIRHEHDILLAEGRDPGMLIETSADTPFGAQILQRFAGLVLQR